MAAPVTVTVDEVAERLRRFAATYPGLPLYTALSRAAAEDPEACRLLAGAAPGQARPVLLLAALHDLVLRDRTVAAARWYPSVDPGAAARLAAGEDPWPDVRATLRDHAEGLGTVIASRTTQTNEVNRSVYVAALLAAAAADVPAAPVALVELGSSAGLLLAVDHHCIELAAPPSVAAGAGAVEAGAVEAGGVGAGEAGAGGVGAEAAGAGGVVVLGDPASPVRCAAALVAGSSPADGFVLPPVVDRVGLDRSPVAVDDAAEVRWLEACLWPDQPERLERFRAAVGLQRDDASLRPRAVAGDMLDDLPAVLASVPGDVHVVVLCSWALTYVERARRAAVAATLAAHAATSGRPVTWATAEPPGCVPDVTPPTDVRPGGETVLALHRWRPGRAPEVSVVGHAHPHATWLHLT